MDLVETGTGNLSERLPSPTIEAGLDAAEALIRSHLLNSEVVVVAIGGGTSCGKTTKFTPALESRFDSVTVLHEDDFCLGRNSRNKKDGEPDLQHPTSYDPDKIAEALTKLKDGYIAEIPMYNYADRVRTPETQHKQPSQVILMEGSYLLQPHLLPYFDTSIVIDDDDHSRFVRRMTRQRRNPFQTDGTRLDEYVRRFYPSHYQQVAPFAGKAALHVLNPYSPEEGYALLRERLPISSVITSQPLQEDFYAHPAMSDQEILSVRTGHSGVQELTYIPDEFAWETGIMMRTNLHHMRVDLTKIGYDLVS